MKSAFMINDRKINLLDQDITFEEGEKVFFEENGEQKIYSVSSIRKAISIIGDNAECLHLVYLQ